jgi:hypothetical protein
MVVVPPGGFVRGGSRRVVRRAWSPRRVLLEGEIGVARDGGGSRVRPTAARVVRRGWAPRRVLLEGGIGVVVKVAVPARAPAPVPVKVAAPAAAPAGPRPTVVGPGIVPHAAPTVVGPGVRPAPVPVKVAAPVAVRPGAVVLAPGTIVRQASAIVPGSLRHLLTYRRGRGLVGFGLGQEGPIVSATPPSAAQLEAALDGANYMLDHAIAAAAVPVAWAIGAADRCYESGSTPAAFWGPHAIDIALESLHFGGLLVLRALLASGAWSWLVTSDGKISAVDSRELATLSAAAGVSGLGWVARRVPADPFWRMIDQLAIAGSMVPATVSVSGPVAATEALVAEGATTVEGARAAVAEAPVAVRAAGAGASATAAVASARSTFALWKSLSDLAARTEIVKWTAAAIVGVVAVRACKDLVLGFKGALADSTETGSDAAAKVVQFGIDKGDKDMIERGLSALAGFQKVAGEADKWTWAALGAIAGLVGSKMIK